MNNYTKLQMAIINAIYTKGIVNVEISANSMGQNKNFFTRITKLKNDGLISITKREGLSSIYSLTEKGVEYFFYNKERIMKTIAS